MSAVDFFTPGARVKAISGLIMGVVLLSAIDSKRQSRTKAWHHFWHLGGVCGTGFGTGN
jgi:hypothetical protein